MIPFTSCSAFKKRFSVGLTLSIILDPWRSFAQDDNS